MRLAPLSLIVSLSVLGASVVAPVALAQDTATVSNLETSINAKQIEFDNFADALEKQLKEANQLQQQLDVLRARSVKLDKDKSQALEAMNETYRRLIEDPSIDIVAAKERYQNAMASLNANKDDIAMQLAAIASQRKKVEEIRVAKHSLLNTIESLKEQLSTARVERLRNELTREGTLELEHTINCKRTETLAACEQRGQHMGMQKATKRFLDQLFANLSEERVVEPKRNTAGTRVQVLSSHVVDSAFSGQGNYSVKLSVTMRGDVNSSRLCNLLNLDNRFCSDYGTPIAGMYPQTNFDDYVDTSVRFNDVAPSTTVALPSTNNTVAVSKPEQPKMFDLTVRSNVRDDEVFIDGVSYGATRLDVALARGSYLVEVRKPGYTPFKKRVNLNNSQTLRARLRQIDPVQSEPVARQVAATPIASSPIANTDLNLAAQNLVKVPAGEFDMGDITGNGLANEQPVVRKVISDPFAIGAKEVTVSEYQTFVDNTNYRTEAEQGKGCAYYLNGEPVWEPSLNWKNPGFEQSNDYPVVCLTYNDAKAYAQWLSESSGHDYRLPTEAEWEYAARAGTRTDYPWGNDIGSNQANCGWCGSPWSNNSTAPVGSFGQNAFGLHDTVGNVWEWTRKTASLPDATVRGGAWNFAPSLARVSTRLVLAPDFRANYIGFRLVREL